MMSRRVTLVHSFLPLVSIATFWCVVYAQSNTDGTSNPNPIECIIRRSWWTSMWGFIVTLVVLTMDVWGAQKLSSESIIINVFGTFLGSALNPLLFPWHMLENTMGNLPRLVNLREAHGNVVIAPLYLWSKSHIKIISGAGVIVNLFEDVYNENYNLNAFEDKVEIKDLSEALVIGTKVKDSKQFNVQLSKQGELALLRSNVLPPYDELKILRGNSSVGMAIASAQAIGYIYGVVVRCVQGLRMSPIEAIACVLNMVILMKGVLHNFTSMGYRPLLLYLVREEEVKFIEECKNVQYFAFKIGSRLKLIVSFTCGGFLAIGAYFIVNFLRSLNIICVIPIILFEVSLLLGGIVGFLNDTDGYILSFTWSSTFSIVLLNLVGYVWALVATFKYWKGEEFDVQSSNYLSQVLPYIG